MHVEAVHEIEKQLGALERSLRRRRFPVAVADLTQEAWVQCLQALPRFDPEAPGAKGYFFRIGKRTVSPLIQRLLSPVTMSRAAAQAGVGSSHRTVGLDDVESWFDGGSAAPDAGLMAAERRRVAASLRVRRMRAVVGAERAVGDATRLAGEAVHGVSGPEQEAGAVARELGMWRRDVEQLAARYRAEVLRRPEIAELDRQIAELERDEP